MKLELKTENEYFSKLFLQFFRLVFFLSLVIILFDVALNLRSISKYYQIDYNCKLLAVEQSTNNFKKLSRLSNLKNKQQIWELCREVIK